MKKLWKLPPLKYINGGKGAISLFLAVLMTPFLSMAVMLVEVGRYNSAVSILDEAMGCSSASLLANYDEYLLDRWGLLAIDQGIDIDAEYLNYLSENSSVLGDSIQLNSVKTSGMYNLGDAEILYNQIMEFSKLNSPTKLATNFLNLSDLIGELEKFKNIGKYFDIIATGADAIDSSITFAETSEDLKKIADELETLKISYGEKYTALETAVSNLADALKETRPTEETEAEKYDENIESLRKKADTAAEQYSEVLGMAAEKLQDYKDAMKESENALASIKSDIASAASNCLQLANQRKQKEEELKELDKKITEMEGNGENVSATALYTQAIEQRAELENEIAEIYLEEGVVSAAKNGLTNVSNSWQQSFASYSDNTMGELITSFKNLKTKVDLFDSSLVDKEFVLDAEEYHHLSIGGYISSADIEAYLEQQAVEMGFGGLSALIDGIISFFNSLCKLQLFYDPSLSSYIDVNYYMENLGGLPGSEASAGGVLAIITDIGDMVSGASEFGKNVVTLKWIDALKEAKKFLDSIVALKEDLVQFAIDIGNNIINLVTSYDRIYYSTYTTFNLPCRTDFTSGVPDFTAMTGYNLTSSSLNLKGQSSNLTLVDDLTVLIDQIRSASQGSGNDITFSGAELEYILFGSNSEVANQMYTFVCLYLIRLLIDIPTILSNAEVQSLASASTLAYPVVIIIEILVEPLIDTVLLVNGESVFLINTPVYLTPTKFPELLGKLCNLLKGMSQSEKDDLGNGLTEAFGVAKDDYNYQKTLQEYENRGSTEGTKKKKGLFEFNYREYCFILLLLTVTKEQQVARLSNLIQMETLYYYNKKGVPYRFNLANSYSYIQVEANVDIKQMLPSLADSSLFTIERQQYRGY